ncbi:MAG: BamA/TamA family outer membrane protein [Salibacteraceae bacterium]
MQQIKIGILSALFWGLLGSALGQQQVPDSIGVDTIGLKNFLVLPIGYYTPETRIAGGFSIGGVYRPVGASLRERPSSVNLIATYTQNRQIIFFLPFSLSLQSGDYLVNGELSYYRYPYFFNGIGQLEEALPDEGYTARFPRFKASGLRRVKGNFYLGGQYWFQDTKMLEIEDGGALDVGEVPGSEGSRVGGLGPVILWDKRDNFFAARSGFYLNLSMRLNANWLGSNFDYQDYLFDARKYFSLGKGHTLAWQGLANFMFGDVPFNRMAMLGGDQQMRGYRRGIFRDKKMMTSQVEYRSALWRNRVGFALFGGLGSVGEETEDFAFNRMVPSYGGGLRFALLPEQRIHVRMDMGWGAEGNAFYLRVNEAF